MANTPTIINHSDLSFEDGIICSAMVITSIKGRGSSSYYELSKYVKTRYPEITDEQLNSVIANLIKRKVIEKSVSKVDDKKYVKYYLQ